MNTMAEYIIGSAIVRIHGTCPKENLKAASECFMKKALKQKKEKEKCLKTTS